MRTDGEPAPFRRDRHRYGSQRFELWILERQDALIALPRSEKDVSADGEEPATAVGTRLVGRPRSIGAQIRLLHEVVSVRVVPGEGAGEPGDILQPGQRLRSELRVSLESGHGYRKSPGRCRRFPRLTAPPGNGRIP